MPIKACSKDVAATIRKLTVFLKRDFGADFMLHVVGKGMTLARHNVAGIVEVCLENPPVSD